MTRKQILNKVRELDNCGVFPYLYDVLTDGSVYSENWLNQLEDANISNEQELVGELETMFATR